MTTMSAQDHGIVEEQAGAVRRGTKRRSPARRRPARPASPARFVFAFVVGVLALGGALTKGYARAERLEETHARKRVNVELLRVVEPASPMTPSHALGRLEELLARADGWALPETHADGLTVERRHLPTAGLADDALASTLTNMPVYPRGIMEVRGSDVVVLRGAALEQPQVAARALALAWGDRRIEDGGARTIALFFYRWPEDHMASFAGFSFQAGGAYYHHGAQLLREVRDQGSSGHPDKGNRLAEATATTMLYSQGFTQGAQRAVRNDLVTLLDALGVTLPELADAPVALAEAPAASR